MAEAEELRQLTLAAKAQLSLGSTQTGDLDVNVLAGKLVSTFSVRSLEYDRRSLIDPVG